MQIINGYQMTKDFSAENAGFCKWGFAEKGGQAYFIKEFLSPKYPLDSSGLSPATIEKKKRQCEAFFAEKSRLYQAIESCRTGNVVTIENFFRDGTKYYIATQRVAPSEISMEQLARLDDEKKYVLTRSLLYSFAKLHSRSIVHADIKPDNILIKRTEAGFYTGKIIDFDSGFFEDSIPEEIQGDQIYLAPEVRLHMMEEEAKITTKIDIFALGILFHQYWSGRLPTILSDYDYVFESVLDDSPVFLDDSIPKLMRKLIGKMLNKNPELRPSAAQILKVLDTLLTSTAAPSDTPEPSGTKEREAYFYDVAAFSGKGGKGFHALGDL